MTPAEFERAVKDYFAELGTPLKEFTITNQELIPASDGAFKMDVTARFEALGVNFLVLIECKHHRNPIKWEVIRTLHDKVRSSGAHKGIVVATAPFQDGAVSYAKVHGIALLYMADGSSLHFNKSLHVPPSPSELHEPYAFWWVHLNEAGNHCLAALNTDGQNREAFVKELGTSV